jgi:hypothetical protein
VGEAVCRMMGDALRNTCLDQCPDAGIVGSIANLHAKRFFIIGHSLSLWHIDASKAF